MTAKEPKQLPVEELAALIASSAEEDARYITSCVSAQHETMRRLELREMDFDPAEPGVSNSASPSSAQPPEAVVGVDAPRVQRREVTAHSRRRIGLRHSDAAVVRRLSVSHHIGLTERAWTGGPAIGGEEVEKLEVGSALFTLWLHRLEGEAYLLVETLQVQGNAITYALVEDLDGAEIAFCDAAGLDRYGRARVMLGHVEPGDSLKRKVEICSPAGTESFDLEFNWS